MPALNHRPMITFHHVLFLVGVILLALRALFLLTIALFVLLVLLAMLSVQTNNVLLTAGMEY